MAGLFITFEGGDGSGKSTQATLVAEELRGRGYDVVVSREPGGTPMGAQIRQLLLHGEDMGPRAEALLYAADRSHHVESVIRPGVEAGKIVIVDRYIDSSVAYQGAARELGTDEVRALSMWAIEGYLPELTLLFDVSTQVGRARVGKELDRLESAGAQFHEDVRSEYLAMAEAESDRFRVIDAEASIEEVTAVALAAIEPLLANLGDAPASETNQ